MGLYVVANLDGHVISSEDGVNWSASFDTGIAIKKVAIGPHRIIYAVSEDEGETYTHGLYQTPAWNQNPVFVVGTENYFFNEVHYLGEKYVAVGYTGSPKVPVHAYSENGVDWIVIVADDEFCSTVSEGGDFVLNDVGHNGSGYFMVGGVEGPNLGGGFYTLDLSQTLGDEQWVGIENFPVDAKQLVFASYPEGGEYFGAWSAFSDDGMTWWSTFSEDPSQGWSFITGWDLTSVVLDATGIGELNIAEATIGMLNVNDGGKYVTWMLSTTQGQIIWWPHFPAGPFLSVPSPHEAQVSSVNGLNPLEVTISGDELPSDGEKITIYGSQGLADLNGLYVVESLASNNYRLHDVASGDAVDGSSWSGSYVGGSATVKLARGTYIDALGYGDEKFFAGNDAEEVFVCSSITAGGELVWSKIDDRNNSFEYWNDLDYGGEFMSCVNQTYKFSEQSPETMPNYRYGGEGNLDTTVYENEDGVRVSRQRTGYFEVVSYQGDRKIVEVMDGETISSCADYPVSNPNPTGNSNVSDSGSTF